jgi:hypothetical protein
MIYLNSKIINNYFIKKLILIEYKITLNILFVKFLDILDNLMNFYINVYICLNFNALI